MTLELKWGVFVCGKDVDRSIMSYLEKFTRKELRLCALSHGLKIGRNKNDTIQNLCNSYEFTISVHFELHLGKKHL